jgi:APA family basic amino acid/polyamine antiporter
MLPKQWFTRKSLETLHAEMQDDNRLRRALGPISLSALGVGAIIGAGIFVMTGQVAALDAGPAIVVSYVVAGLGCALAALCYAEFASTVPVAGSAYTYAYATLGELLAWIIGWDLILEYAMACATVAASWSHYFDEFLRATVGWRVPEIIAADPFTSNGASWFNLPAVLIMLAVTIVLVLGIRESAVVNTLLVLVKVCVVLFVIFVGWHFVDQSNWTGIDVTQRNVAEDAAAKWGLLGQFGLNRWLIPIDDAVRSPFAPYGFSGIMLGAAIVFFAYIGFDSISTHSEEARRPQRDVPIGILASLAVCTVLYVAVAAIITGMEPYPQIDIEAAVAASFRRLSEQYSSSLLRAAAVLIATGALAGMTSVLLVSFLSQARIFLAMARDGLLPRMFGEVHSKLRTPHLSTMLTGGVVSVVAALTPIEKLGELVNIGTLMAFVIVCAAVLILRWQRPDVPRPFRCPQVYVIAPLGILVNVTLMLFLPVDTWLRLVIWLIVGLVIYFMYGQRHSMLVQRSVPT